MRWQFSLWYINCTPRPNINMNTNMHAHTHTNRESDICIKASIGFSCCDGKIFLFLEDSPWSEERVHTLIKGHIICCTNPWRSQFIVYLWFLYSHPVNYGVECRDESLSQTHIYQHAHHEKALFKHEQLQKSDKLILCVAVISRRKRFSNCLMMNITQPLLLHMLFLETNHRLQT